MGKHIHQTRSKMNWKSALALTAILALCIPAQGHVLHVDIEPHSLPGLWANHKPEISGQWLDLLTSMKSRINDESINGDANHILKADVAMSYAMSETSMAYKGKTAVLLEHTFDICDGAVLMAYRAFDGVSRESCEFIGNQDLNRADDLSGGLCDPSKCPGQDNVLTHSVEAVKIGQRVASDKGLKKLGIALEVNPDVNARITMGALEEGEAALERAIDDVTVLSRPPACRQHLAILPKNWTRRTNGSRCGHSQGSMVSPCSCSKWFIWLTPITKRTLKDSYWKHMQTTLASSSYLPVTITQSKQNMKGSCRKWTNCLRS